MDCGGRMNDVIRIAVVDDEPDIAQFILNCIKKETTKINLHCEVVMFHAADHFLKSHRSAQFHVVFLDIRMPNMDGFEISKVLRMNDKDLLIIFVTTEECLVYDSFDYLPFQFIRKREPELICADIASTLQKLQGHISQIKAITLRLPHNEYKRLLIRDIEYIICERHYLQYYLCDGTTVRCRGKIKESAVEMEAYHFIQIHRSYLVNLKYIQRMPPGKQIVQMRSGKILEVSSTFESYANEQYRIYLRSYL